VTTDLDTLLTALYVKVDDMLVKDRRPGHPAELSQSELVCLAVAQALLGFHSERRWIRYATCHLPPARLLSLPAGPVRLQQAAARRPAADQTGHPGPRR
jgi:hypothetical protein